MLPIAIIIGLILGIGTFLILEKKISKLTTRILVSLGVAVAPFILVWLIFLLLFYLGTK